MIRARLFAACVCACVAVRCSTARELLNPPSAQTESITRVRAGQYELRVTGERTTGSGDLMQRFREVAQKLCTEDHFASYETDAQVAGAVESQRSGGTPYNPDPANAFFREGNPSQLPQTVQGHVTCLSPSQAQSGVAL